MYEFTKRKLKGVLSSFTHLPLGLVSGVVLLFFVFNHSITSGFDYSVSIKFFCWATFFIFPIGWATVHIFKLDVICNQAELIFYSFVGGSFIVGLTFLLSSPLKSIDTSSFIFITIVIFSYVYLAKQIIKLVRNFEANWCNYNKTESKIIFLIVILLCLLHMTTLPNLYPEFIKDGVSIAGIGEDKWYFTLAAQISKTGHLGENPFYASQPMIFHHTFSAFLISSFQYIMKVEPEQFFYTRLLFHFCFAFPLLVLGTTLLLFRWNVGSIALVSLPLMLYLPINGIVLHGGWADLLSINGFWFGGLHGDLNYILGMVSFVATLSLFNRIFFSMHENSLDRTSHTYSFLLFGALFLAVAPHIKLNFAVIYVPVIFCMTIYFGYRTRTPILTFIFATVSLVVLTEGIVFLDTVYQGTRSIGINYGQLVNERIVAVLKVARFNSLINVEQFLNGLANWMQPVIKLVLSVLVYAPQSIFLFAFLALIIRPKQLMHQDWMLISLFIVTATFILFVVETGQSGKFFWNFSGHLHYFIPIFALLATGRLYVVGGKEVKAFIHVFGVFVVLISLIVNREEEYRFKPLSQHFVSQDGLEMLNYISKSTPLDAILVLSPDFPIRDGIVVNLANRVLLVSPEFAYGPSFYDFKMRQSIKTSLKNFDINEARTLLSDLFSHTRPVYYLSKKHDNLDASVLQKCINDHCLTLVRK